VRGGAVQGVPCTVKESSIRCGSLNSASYAGHVQWHDLEKPVTGAWVWGAVPALHGIEASLWVQCRGQCSALHVMTSGCVVLLITEVMVSGLELKS
jgi:hypothetical protein